MDVIHKIFKCLIFIVKDLINKGHLCRYIKRVAYEGIHNNNQYSEDGMLLYNKNLSFLEMDQFCKAYNRGVQAANGLDFHIRYRVYMVLYWAKIASSLREGDFIECGVARGFVSSAVMNFLDWNASAADRKFFLCDTFEGIVESLLTPDEKNIIKDVKEYNKLSQTTVYADSYEKVVDNFAEWRNVKIIKGQIPDTLPLVETSSVAFLHIDMNCVAPEVAALEYFWPKVIRGGIIIFDDYAFGGHDLQKNAIDAWAKQVGIMVLTLPTGQGLIIK